MRIGSLVHVILEANSLFIIEALLINRNKTHSSVQINGLLVEDIPNHFIFRIPLLRRISNFIERKLQLC